MANGGGGFVVEVGHNTMTTPDGDLVAAPYGYTAHGSRDIWLLKADLNGNLIWQRCYGGAGAEGMRMPTSSTDNAGKLYSTGDGYLFAGNSSSSNLSTGTGDLWLCYKNHASSTSDVWVVKVKENGEIGWQKWFGGSSASDFGIEAYPVTGGSCVILGTSNSTDGNIIAPTNNTPLGSNDIWLIKLGKPAQ
jgi:hypothetical protein